MADGSFPTLVSKDRDSNAQTNALWVSLSDQTNAVGVDGSGNLQVIVNAALPAGTNNIGDVDVLSVIPGTGATNLGKAVDDAGGATDTGVAALAIRDDALTTLTPVDGDYVRLRTTSTGALWVATTTAGNSNIIQDDSAFTPATDYVGAAGFFADETAPDSVDEGDIGAARMTLDRKQLMVLVDATTDSQRLAIGASGDASVTVVSALPAGTNNIGDVDVLSVIPGTGATNLGKAVDDAAGATDTGVASLFVRDDALTTLTPADGDYVRGRTTSTGALWTRDTVLDANSETAPLYVYQVNTVVSGSEIHDYDTAAAVAGDATSTHDYTVTGTTGFLKSIIMSSSGGSKVEIQSGPLASLATDAVGFVPREGGTLQLFFDPAIEATGTAPTFRLIRTNRQGQAQDLYSTIIANDV